ncbi:MAG: Fic family protein [Alphaproteobacteria bacterium]|nr:Fic family protein [Alphaproteobacteria bacterium]
MPFDSGYKYIDHENLYTDKISGGLLNKQIITDKNELIAFESLSVAARHEQLQMQPIKISNATDLLKIHKFLFQDVYNWAGKPRLVEISKGGRQFLPLHAFDKAFEYINTLLNDYAKIDVSNKLLVAQKLAEILDNINYGHFFREGNGRTQREFLRCLALQKGYLLNLNPIDDAGIYDRYMRGTIDGDINILTNLIFEILVPID